MFTLILNDVTITLPNDVTVVDFSNGVELKVQTGTRQVSPKVTPKGRNITWGPKTGALGLAKGSVSGEIRRTFEQSKVGQKAVIVAGSYNAIWSAVRLLKIKASIQNQGKDQYLVTRTA